MQVTSEFSIFQVSACVELPEFCQALMDPAQLNPPNNVNHGKVQGSFWRLEELAHFLRQMMIEQRLGKSRCSNWIISLDSLDCQLDQLAFFEIWFEDLCFGASLG